MKTQIIWRINTVTDEALSMWFISNKDELSRNDRALPVTAFALIYQIISYQMSCWETNETN